MCQQGHVDLPSQISALMSPPSALKGYQHLALDDSTWGPPWGQDQEVRLAGRDPSGDCDLHTPGQQMSRDTGGEAADRGCRRGGGPVCSGLAAGVDRAVLWAPCPSPGGARVGSCLSWKLGLAVQLLRPSEWPAHRAHEAPSPSSGSPPTFPPRVMLPVPPGGSQSEEVR